MRTYRGNTDTKGKNPKPGVQKWGMQNAVFFTILSPMSKTRNIFCKKALKL
jgi:hypothetical protein